MIDQADTLARVYLFILGAKWGAKDLENHEAIQKPGDGAGNDIHRVGEPESLTPVDLIIHHNVTGEEGISKETK